MKCARVGIGLTLRFESRSDLGELNVLVRGLCKDVVPGGMSGGVMIDMTDAARWRVIYLYHIVADNATWNLVILVSLR